MFRSIFAGSKFRCVVMSGKGCAFYAVRRGRSPGVYQTWSECEAQVKGFKNPAFKKFLTKDEAWDFVNQTKSAASSGNSQNPDADITGKRKHVETASQEVTSSKKVPKNVEGDAGDTLPDINVQSDEKTVVVYTDGASSCNGYHGAQAGIGVYWGPDHPLNTSKRLPGRQTNNRAEIHAAVHALKQAKEIGAKNVKLHSDSKFLIQGITEWIHKWKKNGWKLSGSGGPVINKEDFEELEIAAQGLNVEWVYIKAHDGNDGNVQADKLAVAGARMPMEEELKNTVGDNTICDPVNEEVDSCGSQNNGKQKPIETEDCQKITSSDEDSEGKESIKDDILDDQGVESGEILSVYTDGTCRNYGFSGAQAGIGVYWGPDHPLNTSKRLAGSKQTNNRAEILAAAHALKQAKETGAKNIKLHSDSNFLIKGITEWIHKWKKNGWKLSGTGGPVINKEDFEELDAAREGLNVEWVYVKAQGDDHGNVHANKLAIAGSRKPVEESGS